MPTKQAHPSRSFVKSLGIGGVATLADLLLLSVLVEVFKLDPRSANVPALVAGKIVQFLGCRYVAFGATNKAFKEQLSWFAFVDCNPIRAVPTTRTSGGLWLFWLSDLEACLPINCLCESARRGDDFLLLPRSMGFGEVLSLLSALTWAFSVILFRRVGEQLPALQLNLLKTFFVASLLVPTILIFEPWQWPEMDLDSWLVAAASGVLGITLADTAYFAALNRLGTTRAAVFGSLYTPMVIVLAQLFLGETLNLKQWLGVSLVIFGVFLVSLPEKGVPQPPKDLALGAIFGIGGHLLMAISIVMVKPVLETQPFFWIVGIRMLAGSLSLLPLFLSKSFRKSLHTSFKNPHVSWGTAIGASFLGTYLAVLLWLGGYKYANATVAAVLNESATLWIILLAWLLLKERSSRRKQVGAVLALTGAIATSLLGS